MTNHSYFLYTNTYIATVQTENTASITPLTQTFNILKHSKAQKPTIFYNSCYTTNIPTDPQMRPALEYACCCCLPTPMTLASGGSPMFPLVVHQPASPSFLASSAVTPAGSVHKSRGDNVVRMWVQLKR